MGQEAKGTLLASDEPPPFEVANALGASSFLLISDHAGNAIPRALGTLGLSEADRVRHIAWDIGTAELGRRLAERIDACFIRQNYSRLVVDCNRDPGSDAAMPAVSDGSVVPGNQRLDAEARRARIDEIHAPYQAAIAAEIGRRIPLGRPVRLVALHSFTPRMDGLERPWQIGILHNGGRDTLARRLLAHFLSRPELTVGDNQPYQMDGTDFTVPAHAFPLDLDYAEIEIRQDLLADSQGIAAWTDRLAAALGAAGD